MKTMKEKTMGMVCTLVVYIPLAVTGVFVVNSLLAARHIEPIVKATEAGAVCKDDYKHCLFCGGDGSGKTGASVNKI